MKNIKSTTFLLLVIMGSCSTITRLDSDDFSTVEERVEILKQEIRCFSEIRNAEFELFNVNGFRSQSQGLTIPGASSLDYKFVIKVNTTDVSKWTEGLVKFDPEHYDDNWIKEMVKDRRENWLTTSKPTYYVQQGLPDGWSTILVEFYLEGIIFKRVITN